MAEISCAVYIQRAYNRTETENAEGEIKRQQSQDELSAVNTGAQENDLMAQMALSSIGYIANGGLGLLVIGGLVSFHYKLSWVNSKVSSSGAVQLICLSRHHVC